MNDFLKTFLESARTSIMDGVKFFMRLSLRWKIAFITVITSAIICVAITLVVVKEYQSERLAYIFESHSDAIKSLSSQLTLYLLRTTLKSDSETLSYIPPDLYKIPGVNELIFIKEKGSYYNVYGSDSNSNITKREFDATVFKRVIRDFSDNRILIITHLGQVLASTDSAYFKGKKLDQMINTVLDNDLKTGSTVVEFQKIRYMLSFREVSDSNLIVLAITAIDSIKGDLASLFYRAMFFAFLFCVFSALLQSFYISKITSPLYDLFAFFTKVSRGEFDSALSLPNSEFRPILDAASVMRDEILKRENRLNQLAEGLRNLIEIDRRLENLSLPENLAREIVQASVSILERTVPSGLFLQINGPSCFSFFTKENNIISMKKEDLGDRFGNLGGLQGLIRKDSSKLAFFINLDQSPMLTEFFPADSKLMAIGFFDVQDELGVIVLNIDKYIYHPSVVDFGTVVAKTIQNLYLERAAVEARIATTALNQELSFARVMQEKTVVVAHELPNVDVQWFFKSSQIIGGDFLLVYQYKDLNLVNFYLGDVTGHGVDSAFCTSLISGAIDLHEVELQEEFVVPKSRKDGTDLAKLVYNLNQIVVRKMETKSFSLIAGSFFPSTGDVILVVAGHALPLVLSGNYQPKKVLSKANMGLVGDVDCPEIPKVSRFRLSKGDRMLIYTDGLLENIVTKDSPRVGRKRLLEQYSEICLKSRFESTEESKVVGIPERIYEWSKTNFDGYIGNDDVAMLHIALK